MDSLYYLGLDVHKKSIGYCLKAADGQIVYEGKVAALRTEMPVRGRQLPMSPVPFGAWRVTGRVVC